MKKTSITVMVMKDDVKEWHEIPAYESGVSGLVVHKYISGDWQLTNGQWVVTHKASGMAISPLGRPIVTRKEAVSFAQGLAGLVDWTKSEESLKKETTPEIKRIIGDRIRAACQKYAVV